MGIYNRDYIRGSRPQRSLGQPGDLWAIKFLLIANIAVFLLQNLTVRSPYSLGMWLSLNALDLFPSFQIWRLVTYGFCHGNLEHIAFNMFVLWMFGRVIEPIYGSREFLAFFLGGVIVSGMCHVAFQTAQGSEVGVVGASGGVMAVVFLTAMNYPRMTVLLMFVLPIELRWLAVLYAVVDVTGVFQGGSTVAHAAHLGGAAFGVLYKHYDWRVMRWWERLTSSRPRSRLFRPRPKVRIYEPSRKEPRKDFDKQVDAILEKIHRHGERSLTDQEREILKTASRRYKDR